MSLENEKQMANSIDFAYLKSMSWEELEKSEQLALLKDKYPDLYSLKFHEQFGTK
jgi:hypothetical protein